jgi:AraC-like DNA-binding protein
MRSSTAGGSIPSAAELIRAAASAGRGTTISDEKRSPIRVEASGRDPGEALEVLPGLYDGKRWDTRGDADRYRFRYTGAGDATMTLRTSRMDGWVRGDIPDSSHHVVQWLVTGRATVDVGRDDIALVPGTPLLFPTDRPFVFEFHDYDQRLVHLDKGLVRQLAAERGHDGLLRFDHRRTPSEAASAFWFDTVALASRLLRRGESTGLLWQELSRMTAVAFLELYPPVPEEVAPHATGAGAARVRQAVEFIHRFAADPITPTDVATAVGVSPRALQVGFRAVLGTSPAAFIREVRLTRAHDELVASDALRTTVGAVARHWGFPHLGRFAEQYRRRFGRNPSETLAS